MERRWLWALTSLASAACLDPTSTDTTILDDGSYDSAALDDGIEGDVGSSSQAIVRGEIEEDRDQVMMLLVARLDGNQALCSGTLIAPRLILTAGHCIDQAGSILAYWGNNFEGDFPQLFDPTVPPNNFRFGVEWRQHPDFDFATMDSDVAVVHVDRDLPFFPLPVSFDHLDRRRIGDRVEIVGYGAEESDATNAGGPGAFIKRSGKTVFEGTPPRRPLPPNPHPGLTIRRIREQLMQVDGSPPHANACFGDSGGPALMRFGFHKRVVGVFSWTGDFCEDFSYYVRLDEVRSFVKQEMKLAWKRFFFEERDAEP